MSTIQTMQTEDYSSYLQQLNQAKRKKNKAALQAAYEKNIAALEAEGQGLEGTYRKAKNAAAGTAEQKQRNFAQYAAAQGLNNGAAGQAQLARSIALQNDLNGLEEGKADKQWQLAARRTDAQREYDSALAAAEAQAEAELAEDLYKEQVRRQQAQYQAERDAVKDEQWRQELDFAIGKYWDGKSKDDEKEKADGAKLKLEIPVVNPGKGMNEARFGAAMRSITASIAQGNAEAANSGVQSIWPELTVEQRKQALEALKKQNVQIA